jgi:hypothetical protein
MTYKYRICRNDIAIFGVEDVPEHGILLQDIKHSMKNKTQILYRTI